MKTIRTIAKINTLVVFPIVLAYHESKRFRKMIRFIRTTKPSELIDYTEINAICATLTVVSKLPEQEKTLLQLYYYKEMSLEDVGKQLGLSKSWTSRLHTRAIEKLSRLLRDLVGEYQDVNGTAPKLPPLGGGGGSGAGGRTPLPQISTQPRGPTGR